MAERILITGGAGFIGSHTAQALLRQGHRVRALDILNPPVHPVRSRPAWLSDDVELVVGDVTDRDTLRRALEGIDAVIHLAAYQDYLPDFSTFFRVNTAGTALLYEVIVADRLDIRKVVVASSQACYGEGRHECSVHGPIYPDIRSVQALEMGRWDLLCDHCGGPLTLALTNESRVNPQNQYGLSKYTQELVALSLGRRYGVPTTCMRYSITQGRWQSPHNPYSGICRIFTLRAQAGKPPIVFEDGCQLRDYVYVEDVAAANALVLEDNRADFECFNVGGSGAISAADYANLVVRLVQPGLEPRLPGYFRFGDTRSIVSDSTKLRALGWTNTRPIEDIVLEYASWIDEMGFRDQSTDEGIQRMIELGTIRQAKVIP